MMYTYNQFFPEASEPLLNLCLLCVSLLQPSLPVLYTLSSQATHEAVHLLCRMLVFDPVSTSEPVPIALCHLAVSDKLHHVGGNEMCTVLGQAGQELHSPGVCFPQ